LLAVLLAMDSCASVWYNFLAMATEDTNAGRQSGKPGTPSGFVPWRIAVGAVLALIALWNYTPQDRQGSGIILVIGGCLLLSGTWNKPRRWWAVTVGAILVYIAVERVTAGDTVMAITFGALGALLLAFGWMLKKNSPRVQSNPSR
jgi:hypothetical protein